ncbi:MAG: hypothetical protein ACREA8_12025, partial [Nitrosotalea sp.]
MFDKFRKKKDEFGSVSSGMKDEIADQPGKVFQYEPEAVNEKASEVIEESRFRPSEQVKIPEPIQQTRMSTSGEDIGIKALMDKRTKLEEAID